MSEECCGECKYKGFDYKAGDWVCDCPESDRYGEFVDYDEKCEEWEENDDRRDKRD